jgi:hypothetical protein
MEAAVSPLPREEITPPVIKIYFFVARIGLLFDLFYPQKIL